jgi:large subunit ribosomal protein L15
MRLNTMKPGSRKAPKRVGRGSSAGQGKTCGRGHKGQRARAGGYHKVGFEGGQMPLQRRLPKVGFHSRLARVTAQVRLSDLARIQADVVDLAALRAAGVVSCNIKRAKVFASGTLDKAVVVRGLRVTQGARQAIEGAGGSIE